MMQFRTLVNYLLYRTVHLIFYCLQRIAWLINGTYFEIWKNKGVYRKSAHIQDIICRYKLHMEPAGQHNFFLIHNGFMSPSYVLQDNVSLYCVNTKEAIFVETDENLDIANSDNGSFLNSAQFNLARRIITLPLDIFHKLGENIGDPKAELIFIHNTSRCGSTLLTQIYEDTGVAVCFSEPHSLNTIDLNKDKLPSGDLDKLVKNIIRVQCKPFHNRRIDAFIFKPTPPVMNNIPIIVKSFPNSKQIFMYRDGLKVAQSIVKIASEIPLLALVFSFIGINPKISKLIIKAMGFSVNDFKIDVSSPILFGVLVWASLCQKYINYRKNGTKIVAVKYEDLVNNPLQSARAILKYSNLPVGLAEKAIKALTRDSQRNSHLSMKKISNNKLAKLEGDDKVLADLICDNRGLPRLSDICILDGTITTEK